MTQPLVILLQFDIVGVDDWWSSRLMFVHVSDKARAAKKTGILMGILFLLSGSFGPLLTLHVYVKPSPPVPRGFRIFGFPRPRGENSPDDRS